MEYLIQSRFPIGAVCVEGVYEVVCLLIDQDSDLQMRKSYPVTCETSNECDCGGYLGEDLKKCKCVDGKVWWWSTKVSWRCSGEGIGIGLKF